MQSNSRSTWHWPIVAAFLGLLAVVSFVAFAQELPQAACFQLEGVKPSCVPGDFCVGECTPEIQATISRCGGATVCGEYCPGTAEPDPITCSGNCYQAVRETFTYNRSVTSNTCPGGRQCEARSPDRQVCDESGCRVIAGSCIRYSTCPSTTTCQPATSSCVSGYTSTPNRPTADGCGCLCNGQSSPPSTGTCEQPADQC